MSEPKTKLTAKDIRRFDYLVGKSESRNQLHRIMGRLELRKFCDEFTREALDAAWEKIKNRGLHA